MKSRREVRRLERAVRALPDPGCPACRERKGRIVIVEDGVFPPPCEACGIRPEFVIEFGCSEDVGDGAGEDVP